MYHANNNVARPWSLGSIALLVMFALGGLAVSPSSNAQGTSGVVDYNVNVTGTCAPPYTLDDGTIIEFDCGQVGRQQNEPSCKVNPLNELNRLCAYNDYSLSDLPGKQGDTVIGYSESRDGRFIRRPLTGTRQNHWNGQDFMADPTMLVSEGFAAVTSISGIRGGNSVMQIQRMIELNTETGFRFYSEAGQVEIAKISGSNFIDKPDSRLIDHPSGGTEEVTMTLEDGRTITRELKRVRIVVTFAVFNGSSQNIRTYVTYNDCFGAAECWSNPKQISQTSGLDQGLSVANVGNTFLYVMRRFAEGTEADTIVGSVDKRAGAGNPGKVFDIGSDPEICAFDQVTLPDPLSPRNAVSFRTNDFPWVSATANEFVLVYAERPRDAAGNCLDQGSRVVARTSQNGTKWSEAVEVSPVNGHAFQFMQSVACNDEFCQVLWYDTRNESAVYDALLGASVDEKHWEQNPFIEDFDVNDSNLGNLRFRRTADVYTTRIDIAGNGDPVPNLQPERVSRYVVDDQGIEREVNLMNVQAFGGSKVAFNGDYISINPLGDGNFFAAWTDWRRARPQRGSEPFDVSAPYAVPSTSVAAVDDQPDQESVREVVAQAPAVSDRFLSAHMPRAEGLEDPNPSAMSCSPTGDPLDMAQFDARAKDSEIYGADIEDRVRLVSPTPAKNYCTVLDPSTGNCIGGGLVQRAFVLGLNNDVDVDREFTLVIANQPGNPVLANMGGDSEILENARASWRQLPFGPTFFTPANPDPATGLSDVAPTVLESRLIPGLSSDFVTLFVVSESLDAPVTVLAYDDAGSLVAELTVNGISAAGDLVDPGVVADVRFEEVHNPELFEPSWAGLEINPLNPSYRNPSYRNPSYRNPSYRNPSYRNPSYRNEAYGDASSTDPQSNTTYDYETFEATELLNSSLRNPSYRNEAEHDAFVDVTFGVGGNTNTVSSFNADLAYVGDELNQLDTQLIAWDTNNLDTVQDCDPGQISEETVIAAVNNPDLSVLTIPTIDNNLDGSITFTTPVRGITNVTLRIFGNGAALQELIEIPDGCDAESENCSLLQQKLGWVFSAQAANTEDCNDPLNPQLCQIIKDKTQIIKDIIPPIFVPELVDGTTYSYEATGSDPDAVANIDLVAELDLTAFDNCDPAAQDCSDSEVGVSCSINGTDSAGGIDVPLGESPAACETEPDASPQQNTNVWSGSVLIEDNEAPGISIPAPELVVAPESADGAFVNYEAAGIWDDAEASITVSDNIFKEGYPYPTLSCVPESGTQFPLGSTEVICTAGDAGPCDPAVSSACVVDAQFPDGRNVTTGGFVVTVQDLTGPTFPGLSDGFLADVIAEATAVDTPVTLTTPALEDNIDDSPTATSDAPAPPEFPLGTTVITWTASDFTGNESTAQQRVIVQDMTPPTVTVSFPGGSSQTADTFDGTAVSFDIAIDDIFPDASSTSCESAPGVAIESGDVFPVGDTTVTCIAADSSGNTGTGSATVTLNFQYSASGISGKSSGKNGSSFPLSWAWTDGSGTPQAVSQQNLSLERGTCTSGGGALDPGSSGLREQSDGSYVYNLQAVDPATGEPWANLRRGGEKFCFSVALPSGEIQQKELTIR